MLRWTLKFLLLISKAVLQDNVTFRLSSATLKETNFTGRTEVTVMAELAILLPLCVVAVIVAVPIATAVTNPLASTVATASSLDDQITFLLEAFEGATVAVNTTVLPADIVAEARLTDTLVTATVVD